MKSTELKVITVSESNPRGGREKSSIKEILAVINYGNLKFEYKSLTIRQSEVQNSNIPTETDDGRSVTIL